MSLGQPPPLPREHGAWTMLAIPMFLGLAGGAWHSGAAWLVPASTVLVFLAHHAIVPWAQRVHDGKPSPPGYAVRRLGWGAIYLVAATLVFTCAALAIAGFAAAPATIYALADCFGHARSIVPEALGLAGVSLSGPMMAVAAGKPLDRSLLGIAALALGYFLSSVAFVRTYERMRGCLLAHAATAAALLAVAALGALPRWWWIAFAPVAGRTA